LFPALPPMPDPGPTVLAQMASQMIDTEVNAVAGAWPANSTGDNLAVPAGMTYLGQFIDHDLTFDPVSTLTGTTPGAPLAVPVHLALRGREGVTPGHPGSGVRRDACVVEAGELHVRLADDDVHVVAGVPDQRATPAVAGQVEGTGGRRERLEQQLAGIVLVVEVWLVVNAAAVEAV